jgi:hypothetical protein
MGSQDIGLYDITTERKRHSANVSFQMDLDHGLKLTSDAFYADQDEYDRNVGIQFNSTNWQGATYVPLQSRNTGSTALSQYNTPPPDPNWSGSQIYTTQVYEKWPGDVESYTQVVRKQSTAQDFNLQLDYDNGGPFTAGVRAIRETAKQEYIETDINISDSDGCLWADPNSALPCGTFNYPTQLGGNRVFNANGIPQNTVPIIANFTGRNMVISMPASLAADFANPNAWTMKTLESGDDYNRKTAITALRFDGHYKFNDAFTSISACATAYRSADNDGYTLVTPVYAGIGASDPNGCLVRYVGSDVILSGNSARHPAPGVPRATHSGPSVPARCRRSNCRKPRRPSPTTFRNTPTCWGRGSPSGRSTPNALDNPLAYWKRSIPIPRHRRRLERVGPYR